jgi:hypothetical protein
MPTTSHTVIWSRPKIVWTRLQHMTARGRQATARAHLIAMKTPVGLSRVRVWMILGSPRECPSCGSGLNEVTSSDWTRSRDGKGRSQLLRKCYLPYSAVCALLNPSQCLLFETITIRTIWLSERQPRGASPRRASLSQAANNVKGMKLRTRPRGPHDITGTSSQTPRRPPAVRRTVMTEHYGVFKFDAESTSRT